MRPPLRRRSHRRRRPGFTLVEVLVAMVLLVTGMMALAGATAAALRLLVDARLEEDAAFLAARRLELLRATPCGRRAGGSEVAGAVEARWTVAPQPGGGATRIAVLAGPRARPLEARDFRTMAPC